MTDSFSSHKDAIVTTGANVAEACPSAGHAKTLQAFPLRLLFSGFFVVILFLSSLIFWVFLAPLEGAVISQGVITVASSRKQIQHLEGGIVDAISVKDGDKVRVGQLLVKLRDVQSVSALRQLEAQYVEAQTVVARLLAERGNVKQIVFPEALMQRSHDAAISAVMSGQVSIFNSHQTLMHDRLAVIEKKIAQTEQEINGLRGQIEAKKHHRELIFEESKIVELAFKKQLAPKTDSLQLKQRLAETQGELISYQSQVGRLEQSILELRLQKSEALALRITEVSEQLRMQRANMFDLSQKVIAARDVHHRTKIVSPIDGVVVNLSIHSNYGVIAAGQPLMEIVPYDDELVVAALIDPDDINEVWAGMPADVLLTSLSRRERVPLQGVLSNVSADRLTDPVTGKAYYRARIVFYPGVIDSSGINLIAGMGADVFLRTSARTPIDYLLSPISKSLQKGLREE